MNRKLLNGLLVIAFAAGGVGTFTSCKDEDFRSQMDAEYESLQQQINAIRAVEDAAFKQSLQDWLNYWTDQISTDDTYGNFDSYEDMVGKLDKLYNAYKGIIANPQDYNNPQSAELVEGIWNWIKDRILPGEEWYQNLQADHSWMENLLERASSISVSQTYNPVLGSVNLPVGLSSRILATYVYRSENGAITFPTVTWGDLSEASQKMIFGGNADFNKTMGAIKAIATAQALEDNSFNVPTEFGNMGGAVVTINPANVDFTASGYTVELVDSKDNVVLSSADGQLELAEFDGDLTFGYTRAEGQSIYALNANADAAVVESDALALNIDKTGLKDAFKQALDNKTASNFAHLAEALVKSVNNKLPAYAVKLSWTENVPVKGADGTYSFDANGNIVTEEEVNSVVSDYDIAAVIAHPLSYDTEIGKYIPSGKSLPMISPLTEYLDKIENKLTLTFDRPEMVDAVTVYIVVDNGVVYFYESKESYEAGDEPMSKGSYTTDGLTMTDDELTILANALVSNYNEQIVNADVVDSINDAINDINKALDQAESKVSDFKSELEKAKDSKLLTYGQKLVDLYNEVAEKVNNFLADPDHYLQVMMVYSGGDGAHHLSTDPNYPTRVNSAMGNAISLYATSYNGEIIVPSFKKYVAVTAYKNGNNAVNSTALTAANSANYNGGDNAAYLNTVLEGQTNRIPVNISYFKGQTVTITYLSVDYRGKCSMQNYYVYVY